MNHLFGLGNVKAWIRGLGDPLGFGPSDYPLLPAHPPEKVLVIKGVPDAISNGRSKNRIFKKPKEKTLPT